MKTSLIKSILSTSCLSLFIGSTSVMAELKDETLIPHSPRTHKRQQAIMQLSASEKLATEGYKQTSATHYAAARETAEKLAKDFGKVAGAQKLLDIQEGIFWMQRNKVDYRIAFKPTTQPWIKIETVKDRPTAGTSYERTPKKPHTGPLKIAGTSKKAVTAKVGFLAGLNREELFAKETARKKPKASRVEELHREIEEFYTEAGEAGNAKALNNLAVFLAKKGETKRAEELLTQSLTTKGNRNTLNLNNLGEIFEAQRRFKEAEQAYKASAKNGCIQARYNLAMLYLDNGNYKKAYELFEKLNKSEKLATTVKDGKTYVKLAGNDANVDPALIEMSASVKYNLAALIIGQKGLTAKACKLLNQVAYSNGHLSGEAHYKLFKELKNTDISAAYNHVKEAAKAKLPHAQYDYGRLLAQTGKNKQAMRQFQRAAKQGDTHAAGAMVPLLEKMKASLEMKAAVSA